jgi:methyltransferase-like protein
MVRYHTAGLSAPQQIVDRAREMLAMGAAVHDQKHGPYAELLREEYYVFSTFSDEQLYHLVSSAHHQPFYFREFVQRIADVGLQFLSDADPARLFGPREPAAVRTFLDGLPRLERQQYVDFLMNCTSRSALVCHRDVAIREDPDESVLCQSWISLAAGCRDVASADPLIQAALSRLKERRPEFVRFDDLATDGASTARFFMDAYAAGHIDVTLSPPRLTGAISDHPVVSPLVRLQAQDGQLVTNQKCETVRLTDLACRVATLLDGVHSRDDVADSVARDIQLNGVALDAGRVTDDILGHLRDHALLLA